jgi:hypothetical protein
VRVLSYVNHAHMGDYRESVQQYLAGKIATPDITQTERNGAVKYGFGLNTEQEVTDSLRLFARFGWNEDQHESFAYTEVGQTILFGGDYAGISGIGSNDKVGVAFVSNAIKRDHQNYLHYGGLGFLSGRRRPDVWARGYSGVVLQRPSLARTLRMTGGSEIAHPGYNASARSGLCVRLCARTSIFEKPRANCRAVEMLTGAKECERGAARHCGERAKS